MLVTAMPAPILSCLRWSPARSHLKWGFPTGRTRSPKAPPRPGTGPVASRPIFLPPVAGTRDVARAAVLENATLISFAGFGDEADRNPSAVRVRSTEEIITATP